MNRAGDLVSGSLRASWSLFDFSLQRKNIGIPYSNIVINIAAASQYCRNIPTMLHGGVDFRGSGALSTKRKKKKGRDALTGTASRHSSSPSGVRLPAPLAVLPRATHPPTHIVVRTPCESPPFSLSFGASSRRARPRTRHLPPSASTRVHCESISRNRCLTPPLPPPPPTGCKHTHLTHTRTSARDSGVAPIFYSFFFIREGFRKRNARFNFSFFSFLFFFFSFTKVRERACETC